jgi:hypothetical protein
MLLQFNWGTGRSSRLLTSNGLDRVHLEGDVGSPVATRMNLWDTEDSQEAGEMSDRLRWIYADLRWRKTLAEGRLEDALLELEEKRGRLAEVTDELRQANMKTRAYVAQLV